MIDNISNKMLDIEIATFLWSEYNLCFISNTYDWSTKNAVFYFSKKWVPLLFTYQL